MKSGETKHLKMFLILMGESLVHANFLHAGQEDFNVLVCGKCALCATGAKCLLNSSRTSYDTGGVHLSPVCLFFTN